MGVIGHFLTNKAMLYNPDGDKLEPEKGTNEPKKLIDLSVMKKGANF